MWKKLSQCLLSKSSILGSQTSPWKCEIVVWVVCTFKGKTLFILLLAEGLIRVRAVWQVENWLVGTFWENSRLIILCLYLLGKQLVIIWQKEPKGWMIATLCEKLLERFIPSELQEGFLFLRCRGESFSAAGISWRNKRTNSNSNFFNLRSTKSLFLLIIGVNIS